MHGKRLLDPYPSMCTDRYVIITEYTKYNNNIIKLDCGSPNISSGVAIEPFSSTIIILLLYIIMTVNSTIFFSQEDVLYYTRHYHRGCLYRNTACMDYEALIQLITCV